MERTGGWIDLHVHTNRSDGMLSPRKVMSLVHEKKLRAISITDHNSVSGITECAKYGREFEIEVVPGIEIGIRNEAERELKEVHMLGYFIDCGDRRLLDVLDRINESKKVWLRDQVRVMNEVGLRITEDDVKKAAGETAPSRPHVWRAVEKYSENHGKIQREEFYKRTAFGGGLYIKKGFEISLEDCIKLIKNVGGIPVLAHPGLYNTDKVVKFAVDAGIEGLEVNYSYADVFGKEKSREIVMHVDELADRYSLLKTGGSDFHDTRHGTMLGSVEVPYEYLEVLKKHASLGA